MEEPMFIKCEPAWPLDAEGCSDFEQNTRPPLDNEVKIKEDPLAAVPDPSLEEVDINVVKEPCSDGDEMEECDNRSGSSHEIHPSLFSTTSGNTVTISNDSEIKPVIAVTDETTCNCDSCGRIFKDEDHFKKHQFSCCPEDDNRQLSGRGQYVCEKCNKKFTQRKHLIQHIFIHTGQKPHSCSECGKAFASRSNLKSHVLLHKGNRPHVCANCGLAFARRSGLNRHNATHTTSKPYCCSICGKEFKHQSSWKKHSVVHSKEKPFSCKTCGSSFSRTENLRAHLLVHDRTLAHSCATCGKTFRQIVTLKRHIVKHSVPSVSENVPGNPTC